MLQTEVPTQAEILKGEKVNNSEVENEADEDDIDDPAEVEPVDKLTQRDHKEVFPVKEEKFNPCNIQKNSVHNQNPLADRKRPAKSTNKSEPTQAHCKRTKKIFSCDKCEKAYAKLAFLDQHRESVHEGVKYPCDRCLYSATRYSSLKQHIQSIHEKKRHLCDQCQRPFVFQSDLTRHKKTVHKGAKLYACDKCMYTTTSQLLLKNHVRAKHTLARFACESCDYVATFPSDLVVHKRSIHEGVRYPCTQCDYAATQKHNLIRHIKSKHTT